MMELCEAIRLYFTNKSWICDIADVDDEYTNAVTTNFVTVSPIRERHLKTNSNQGLPRRREFEIVLRYTSPKTLDNNSLAYRDFLTVVKTDVLEGVMGDITVQGIIGDIEDVDTIYLSESKEKDVWISESTIRGTLSNSMSVDLKI